MLARFALLRLDAVAILRGGRSAAVLVLAVALASVSVPICGPKHPNCLNAVHDCGEPLPVASCCGGAGEHMRLAIAVAQPQSGSGMSVMTAVLPAPWHASVPRSTPLPRMVLPGASPPDLRTLYASLLI